MSDDDKIEFELNITGSVKIPTIPKWLKDFTAGFSPELAAEVVKEHIADGLEAFFQQHEAEHGAGAAQTMTLDEYQQRKTAAQHAQTARERLYSRRGRPAKAVDPQAAVRTRNAFLSLDDTVADPFGLGLANSAKLDVISAGSRATEDDPISVRRLADALRRHADLLAKSRKVH